MWSARGIAEHAYCPRLFYYMTVEGVFVPNSDTEEGAGAHRRVDRPSVATPESATIEKRTRIRQAADKTEKLEDAESDPDRPRSIRSLTLTSERLGLTAKLDLTEIDGTTAVPVEYRKGKPKRCRQVADATDDMMEEPRLLPAPEPWPTDRVQLGLQVLLLEEVGYTVPEAYIYYGAEKLKLRVPVDDALREAAMRELETAKLTAKGQRPPPLVNDPRCPRCSLQPICLPDEINHQRLAGSRVWNRRWALCTRHGRAVRRCRWT